MKESTSIKWGIYVCLVSFLIITGCSSGGNRGKAILVFSKTAGFRHESIEAGKKAMIRIGEEEGFTVDTTEDASAFTEENLKNYSAVVFLSTSGDFLDAYQQADFERYIQSGGGFVGIHGAAAGEYNWRWYGRLLGAYFDQHPAVQHAKVVKTELDFDATSHLPDVWERTDEWYNYKEWTGDNKVVLTLDESSYEGGTMGGDHPIAWYKEFDGGRMFYTGLGHTLESYEDPHFLNHLTEGIRYAIGDNKREYSKARYARLPEETRFTKVVLASNLFEPTEMAVLPDGKVLFLERRGKARLYDPATGQISIAAEFNLYTEFEYGLMGLTLDPNFKQNNRIYVYYSHPTEPVQKLARFEFAGGTIDLNSEVVLLEVPVQRIDCCHTGGSLTFDSKGLLYLSTGDDTNPFESNGYGPIDERPGRAVWDAQKSSANSNDLRGKVLRIKPLSDGTYEIPEGNLFPPGTPDTRPEIYVMGCRNPYRIAVDPKTGFLYWGDVGPDAAENNPERGPRGYDEVNQAKQAGNFGWPLFVGNNFAYRDYNFATGKSGDYFDPETPVNNSPNNTGVQELPPAQPAYIYYPYAASEEFPELGGGGGRNAMAAPFYYSENYQHSSNRFPDYFNGKLIAYDWIRGIVNVVTMGANGELEKMERFMPGTRFNNIIDMDFGPDGSLFILEYGTGWFSQNVDATLTRIDYNPGNRAPQIALEVDTYGGAAPLTVKFSAKNSLDYDKDSLSFQWAFADAANSRAEGAEVSFTYNEPGVYYPNVTVTDGKGGKTYEKVEIKVGNARPEISFDILGNQTFFWNNSAVGYQIKVTDAEDGSVADGTIDPSKVFVSLDYLETGSDLTGIAQGHQMAGAVLSSGASLIEESDCRSCHKIKEKSIGPAYEEVAKRYAGQNGAAAYLVKKVQEGGGGNWGETAMAAHPGLSEEDAGAMVNYILALTSKETTQSLPVEGKLKFGDEAKGEKGIFFLTASYSDEGGSGISPLTATARYSFRSPVLQAEEAQEIYNAQKLNLQGGGAVLNEITHGTYTVFEDIDLTDVTGADVRFGKVSGGQVEFRIDGINGQQLGVSAFSGNQEDGVTIPVRLQRTEGKHDLYVIFKNEKDVKSIIGTFDWLHLKNR